jgi:5'-3' exonuclease
MILSSNERREMHSLIDADILIYRIGFTTQDQPIEIAEYRLNELIEKILEDTKATSYQLYLTASKDATAFRKQAYPEYKGNRKAPRPIHYEALREYLVNDYAAIMVSTIEADDAISIAARTHPDCTVVSIDKDLLQIPGLHYNFVKEEFKTISLKQGLRWFYKQMITGDPADNIKGIRGKGEVFAEKLLSQGDSEEEWFALVREEYGHDEEMYQNGMCLWMMDKPYPEGTWALRQAELSQSQEMESVQLSFQKPTLDCSDVFTSATLLDGTQQAGSNQLEPTL